MAFDLASARSLIATSSSPQSGRSRIARATRRPIRPKPLIATLVAMSLISLTQSRNDLRPDGLGGEAEALEKVFRRRGGPKAVEAAVDDIEAGLACPAERRARSDRDAPRNAAAEADQMYKRGEGKEDV